MTPAKAIFACWTFVAAVFAWIWWDAPEKWAMIATGACFLTGIFGALLRPRWAGGLLIIASIALLAAVLYVLVALGGMAHGGGHARPFAVVIMYIGVFVFPLIAAFSILMGVNYLRGDASSDENAARKY